MTRQGEYLAAGEAKLSKGPGVQKMFDAIAGRYDLMNRVMTLGQDQRWRKYVVHKAGDVNGVTSLDLATGTGDIAALMEATFPQTKVIGADFAENMLKEARRRFQNSHIDWYACDANVLPFGESVFDSVTFGYLLRNVDDVGVVLREVFRVLKPGGRVVCLDTTPPEKNLLYPFVRLYLKYGIPIMGKFIADDEAAYAYLTGSTMAFHDADELADHFSKAGLVRVGYKKFMFGTIGVHWGEKP